VLGIILLYWEGGGTLYCSPLKHYSISLKVVGSMPNEVDGFNDLPNPSSRIMALGRL
jgi:hypothetical protein